jgi:hypothetical protein
VALSYASAAALIDWPTAVSFNRAPGYQVRRAYGANVVVGTTEVDVWQESGKYPWLDAAEYIDFASTDAADTALGTGARSLLIAGLDNDCVPITEVVPLDGTTPARTVNQYYRLEECRVFAVGSGETQAGTIRGTAATAGTVQTHLAIGTNIAQGMRRTVPAGRNMMIKIFEFGIHKLTGGGAPTVIFHAELRRGPRAPLSLSGIGVGPWLEIFREHMDSGVVDTLQFPRPYGVLLPTGTDISVHVISTAANTDVRASMLLVEGPENQ